MILKVCCCSSPGVCYIGRWVLYRWRHLERPGFVIYGLFYVEVYPSLWYFGHLMQRADSLKNILMLGKMAGKRRSGCQRMKWLDSTTDPMDMNLSKLWEIVEDRGAWYAAVHGVIKSWTWLSNWTTTTTTFPLLSKSIFFYHKWLLNFVKIIFCIYWDDHMVFIFHFVNMVHHIDWFAYIEVYLHPWNKSYLIMVFDLFNMLLDSVC